MEYIPKPSNRKSDLLVITFFALTVILYGIGKNFGGIFHFIPQVCALFTLTVCIYLAVRYRFTDFRYTLIEDDDGGKLLTVYRSQGKREIAECRMSGCYHEAVTVYNGKTTLKEAKKGKSVYNYTASMSPKEITMLVFGGNGEKKTAILLECDEIFYTALNSIVRDNLAKEQLARDIEGEM